MLETEKHLTTKVIGPFSSPSHFPEIQHESIGLVLEGGNLRCCNIYPVYFVFLGTLTQVSVALNKKKRSIISS
jgi:hypothetical protein